MNSQTFLSLLAKDLVTRKNGDLKGLVVVLPNRRAGWAFRQELIKWVKQPAWAPDITSIDDWLIRLSGLREADSLTQLAHLYKAFSKHVPGEMTFSTFIDLGETLLKDFEDLDKYLVDARSVFRAVGEFRNLELLFEEGDDEGLRTRLELFIQAFGRDPSLHQKKWLDIWNHLADIYDDFHKSLDANLLATSGMMYRKAARKIVSDKASMYRKETVLFAGFNILTRAEETIFQELKRSGVASFYWDFHPSYLNKFHEAGRFIRKYMEEFPAPADFQPFPKGEVGFFDPQGNHVLNILPMTSNTAQVQFVASQNWANEPGHHLIVLSDESLMPDLASAWKSEQASVNFTTGFPVAATVPASFFRTFLKMWNEWDVANSALAGGEAILSDLRQHPLFKALKDDIRESFRDWLLKGDPDPRNWIGRFLDMINTLLESGAISGELDRAAALMIHRESSRINEIISHLGLEIDGRGLRHFISSAISSGKIQLEADYQSRILVAGILETRLLDFDSITILSFNEGVWPSRSLPGSLIPYSLRKYFGLPTAENRDAMYAYYFYRLIQRASKVNLIYLTGHMDDGIRVGEKSRYVRQLEYEHDLLKEYGQALPVKVASEGRLITVEKNSEVVKALDTFFDPDSGKSLSASALNDYLDCSLRFCLTYVFGMRQPLEEESPSDPKGFGHLIHNTLETLYKPFATGIKPLTGASLKDLISDEKGLLKILGTHYSDNEGNPAGNTGKDDIARLVAREFVISVLKKDLDELPETILGLEKKIFLGFGREECGFDKDVRLKAVVDRIDRFMGLTRVVDYKTGKCELNFSGLDELFDASKNQRRKEIFQVLFYAELISSAELAPAEVMPSLYPLIDLRAGKRETRVTMKSEAFVYSEIRDNFREKLATLIAEIFNPGVPFTQTKNDFNCRYCPFAGICMRD
jgi:CRISPR/Cas system-associated exonuclease Cas4 (RecB family)